jgi:hypothetical protein
MSDKQAFDAGRLSIIEFKFTKGQVDTPEDFEMNLVDGHLLENSLQLGFNLKEKLIKSDFIIELKTDSKGANAQEATGSFHLVFIFKVENLDELVQQNKNTIKLNPDFGNALAAITYSTSRGILLTRLQGTAFQNFILPVINPNKLLDTNKH